MVKNVAILNYTQLILALQFILRALNSPDLKNLSRKILLILHQMILNWLT